MPAIEVTNDRKAHRLEVKLDGEEAFAEYRITRGGIVFPHTLVPEAFRGRGVASAIAREGLKFAGELELKVIPLCDFFAGYIARHPEHKGQVHPRYLDRVEAAAKDA
jgi:predicted GNAT family acetyltransferase